MRQSKTLKKIRNGEVIRVCGLGHYVPAYVSFAAKFGFDCIWLDLEHRTMDSREIQALMAFCHLFDIDCMLRPPTLEKSRLYRYLEDGASGLLIPHVSTPEKASALVQAVKFPPLGDRGVDGAGLDVHFSLPDSLTYAEQANRETFLFVQIETPQAVRNVDEIVSIDGIDGVFVGPADLSLRLNHQTDGSLTLDEARQIVADTCRRHGKVWGQPTGTEEQMSALIAQGAQLLTGGSEFMGMIKSLSGAAQVFDSLLK